MTSLTFKLFAESEVPNLDAINGGRSGGDSDCHCWTKVETQFETTGPLDGDCEISWECDDPVV